MQRLMDAPAVYGWERLRAAVVLALCLIAIGCGQVTPTEQVADASAEMSFAEQLDAVRNGASDQIRLDRTMVGDADLEGLDGLEERLRRINLSRTDISDAGLARIAQMRGLVQLRLGSERITDAGLAPLAELKELRHLHLIDAPIGDGGLEHLHALKHLESLYLDGSRTSDEARGRLVEALPGVHLHFEGGHHRADPRSDDHEHRDP